MKTEEDLFKNVELQTPSNTNVRVRDVIVDEAAPSMTSPEWTNYVLSLFDESEFLDGYPLVHGLRRVAEIVLGAIVRSGPTHVFPPKDDNGAGRATVVWAVEFANGMTFSDVADCWDANTDDTFLAFNMATAATRAEGRALRKALRIRVVAAEEMTKKNTAAAVKAVTKPAQSTHGEYEDASGMTDAQANFIDIKSKQLNINTALLFKEVFNVALNRKVSKQVASNSIDKLNEYQKNISSVPQSIVGYVENWRNA